MKDAVDLLNEDVVSLREKITELEKDKARLLNQLTGQARTITRMYKVADNMWLALERSGASVRLTSEVREWVDEHLTRRFE